MPRGRKWIELDPKECEADDCDNTFERRLNQTTSQFRTQKFCSCECGRTSQRRPGRDKQKMCGRQLHEMTEENIYTDAKGARRCKPCIQIRDSKRADRQAGARSEGRTRRTTPLSVPSVDIPNAVPGPPPPKWRPAGFTPEPKVPAQVAS